MNIPELVEEYKRERAVACSGDGAFSDAERESAREEMSSTALEIADLEADAVVPHPRR